MTSEQKYAVATAIVKHGTLHAASLSLGYGKNYIYNRCASHAGLRDELRGLVEAAGGEWPSSGRPPGKRTVRPATSNRVNIAGVEAALSDLRRIYEEMDRGR